MEIAFDKVTILASSDPAFSVDTFFMVYELISFFNVLEMRKLPMQQGWPMTSQTIWSAWPVVFNT